jgi:hypothetical protein
MQTLFRGSRKASRVLGDTTKRLHHSFPLTAHPLNAHSSGIQGTRSHKTKAGDALGISRVGSSQERDKDRPDLEGAKVAEYVRLELKPEK